MTRVRHSLASLFGPKAAAASPVAPPDDFAFPWADPALAPVASTADAARRTGDAFASLDDALPTAEVTPELADTLPPETPIPVAIPLFDEPDDPGAAVRFDQGDDEPTHEFEVPTARSDVEPGVSLAVRLARWIDRLAFWRTKEVAPAAPAPETVVGGNPVFLYSKFRTFYNEIIRFKHQRSEFTAGFATALMSDPAASLSGPDAAAEMLSRKLIEILELQAAEAKWMGGEMMKWYPEAQFAMAALADETLMQVEWEGQTVWADHLLERKLYHTHGASHELFKRIDRLLKDAPNTPVSRDLARVYLLVLAAGFQGKYRPFGLPRALAEYRQRLYEYIYRDDALLLYAPERRIFPEVTTRTLEGHAVTRFSAAQRWAAILAIIAIGYTVIAHVAWNRVSSDLQDVTSRIVADTSPGER